MTTFREKLLPCVSVIGILVADPVLAGDPGPAPVDPVVAAPPSVATDWSGPYAGLTFGAVFGRSVAELDDYFGPLIEDDVDDLGLFPRDIDEEGTGAIGGVTLGYNHQRGNFVGGIELDLSALDNDVTARFSRYDGNFGSDTDTTYGTDISGLSTLRARAGFAQDRNLFYATAGFAAGRVENSFSLDVPNFPVAFGGAISEDWSEDGTRYGYVIGVGMERMLTDRLSLKGEIMYYDLEDVTIKARSGRFPGQGIDYEFDNDGYVARAGINLSF